MTTFDFICTIAAVIVAVLPPKYDMAIRLSEWVRKHHDDREWPI